MDLQAEVDKIHEHETESGKFRFKMLFNFFLYRCHYCLQRCIIQNLKRTSWRHCSYAVEEWTFWQNMRIQQPLGQSRKLH